jgi:hypothetical protein
MNLLEIRTESMRRYSEQSATTSYILPADWNSFINEGIKVACTKGFAFKRSKTATILTTIPNYTFPWDCVKADAILDSTGVPLTLIEANLARLQFLVTGKPLYYYLSQTPLITTARGNLTDYVVDDIVTPSSPNGYLYECVTAGTSAAAPPTYPVTWGTRIADGSVVWACREMFTSLWSFTLVDTPTTAGGGTGSYTLVYSGLDEGLFVDSDAPNFTVDKHFLLTSFACYKAALKSKDLTMSQVWLNEFLLGFGIEIPSSKEK